MSQAILEIKGMSCGGCIASIERVLDALNGVRARHVEVGRATLDIDRSLVSEAQLRAAIDDAGFDVGTVTIT